MYLRVALAVLIIWFMGAGILSGQMGETLKEPGGQTLKEGKEKCLEETNPTEVSSTKTNIKKKPKKVGVKSKLPSTVHAQKGKSGIDADTGANSPFSNNQLGQFHKTKERKKSKLFESPTPLSRRGDGNRDRANKEDEKNKLYLDEKQPSPLMGKKKMTLEPGQSPGGPSTKFGPK